MVSMLAWAMSRSRSASVRHSPSLGKGFSPLRADRDVLGRIGGLGGGAPGGVAVGVVHGAEPARCAARLAVGGARAAATLTGPLLLARVPLLRVLLLLFVVGLAGGGVVAPGEGFQGLLHGDRVVGAQGRVHHAQPGQRAGENHTPSRSRVARSRATGSASGRAA
ncbi:hypothetical protein GCM10025872_25090 [Barrientosiimonas endolithica]|uniref:Uncharacterized protein n=1 Tax=Barrientosiimonas endolithica TaxID=1535208 RepID=A0ABM8HD94_9MICO|nr:hypothetical protein GCM10025872_25090 [Barrientosiimonas endolithica]